MMRPTPTVVFTTTPPLTIWTIWRVWRERAGLTTVCMRASSTSKVRAAAGRRLKDDVQVSPGPQPSIIFLIFYVSRHYWRISTSWFYRFGESLSSPVSELGSLTEMSPHGPTVFTPPPGLWAVQLLSHHGGGHHHLSHSHQHSGQTAQHTSHRGLEIIHMAFHGCDSEMSKKQKPFDLFKNFPFASQGL